MNFFSIDPKQFNDKSFNCTRDLRNPRISQIRCTTDNTSKSSKNSTKTKKKRWINNKFLSERHSITFSKNWTLSLVMSSHEYNTICIWIFRKLWRRNFFDLQSNRTKFETNAACVLVVNFPAEKFHRGRLSIIVCGKFYVFVYRKATSCFFDAFSGMSYFSFIMNSVRLPKFNIKKS